jgi:hypothetical protein
MTVNKTGQDSNWSECTQVNGKTEADLIKDGIMDDGIMNKDAVVNVASLIAEVKEDEEALKAAEGSDKSLDEDTITVKLNLESLPENQRKRVERHLSTNKLFGRYWSNESQELPADYLKDSTIVAHMKEFGLEVVN